MRGKQGGCRYAVLLVYVGVGVVDTDNRRDDFGAGVGGVVVSFVGHIIRLCPLTRVKIKAVPAIENRSEGRSCLSVPWWECDVRLFLNLVKRRFVRSERANDEHLPVRQVVERRYLVGVNEMAGCPGCAVQVGRPKEGVPEGFVCDFLGRDEEPPGVVSICHSGVEYCSSTNSAPCAVVEKMCCMPESSLWVVSVAMMFPRYVLAYVS